MILLDLENDDSWYWFSQNLKAAFGDIVIASNDHKSIPKAISVVYNSAEHGLCCFYIFKNPKKTDKSQLQLKDYAIVLLGSI